MQEEPHKITTYEIDWRGVIRIPVLLEISLDMMAKMIWYENQNMPLTYRNIKRLLPSKKEAIDIAAQHALKCGILCNFNVPVDLVALKYRLEVLWRLIDEYKPS